MFCTLYDVIYLHEYITHIRIGNIDLVSNHGDICRDLKKEERFYKYLQEEPFTHFYKEIIILLIFYKEKLWQLECVNTPDESTSLHPLS